MGDWLVWESVCRAGQGGGGEDDLEREEVAGG